MATIPDPDHSLDLQEQIARINRMQREIGKWDVEMLKTIADVKKIVADIDKSTAETVKIGRDTRLLPWTMILTVLGAASAFFAAGAAFMKLATG